MLLLISNKVRKEKRRASRTGGAERAVVRRESKRDQNSVVRAGRERVEAPEALRIRARVLRKWVRRNGVEKAFWGPLRVFTSATGSRRLQKPVQVSYGESLTESELEPSTSLLEGRRSPRPLSLQARSGLPSSVSFRLPSGTRRCAPSRHWDQPKYPPPL